jgi:hypothetical protein
MLLAREPAGAGAADGVRDDVVCNAVLGHLVLKLVRRRHWVFAGESADGHHSGVGG